MKRNGRKAKRQKVGEEVRGNATRRKGKEGEKRRKEKKGMKEKEGRRIKEKGKKEERKRGGEPEPMSRREQTGWQRTRNCATRGRFPPTPVILRLGVT